MSVAVYPLDDIKEHDPFSTACECAPTIICEPNCEMVIIHNSFDGREAVEQADSILGNRPYYRADTQGYEFQKDGV